MFNSTLFDYRKPIPKRDLSAFKRRSARLLKRSLASSGNENENEIPKEFIDSQPPVEEDEIEEEIAGFSTSN